jgi:uncharacterized SAM-binding protein YcdF (DUF218 family)
VIAFWRHRRGRWIAMLLGALVALGVWLAGFVGFVRQANRTPAVPAHADGIVALTGGAERVERALHLLADGRADWLLISGIGPGIELAPLARRAGLDPGPLAAHVRLGRQATSTRGNAVETAAWVKAKDIRTLIVVTAWYHMPRALTELRRALPGVVLHPAPVDPEASRQPGLVMARLLLEEYTKYLAARLDLTALIPEREPVAARSTHPG